MQRFFLFQHSQDSRLNKIYELIDEGYRQTEHACSTGVLNEGVTEAVAMQQPPSDKGKRLMLIYYITQVSVKPFCL